MPVLRCARSNALCNTGIAPIDAATEERMDIRGDVTFAQMYPCSPEFGYTQKISVVIAKTSTIESAIAAVWISLRGNYPLPMGGCGQDSATKRDSEETIEWRQLAAALDASATKGLTARFMLKRKFVELWRRDETKKPEKPQIPNKQTFISCLPLASITGLQTNEMSFEFDKKPHKK